MLFLSHVRSIKNSKLALSAIKFSEIIFIVKSSEFNYNRPELGAHGNSSYYYKIIINSICRTCFSKFSKIGGIVKQGYKKTANILESAKIKKYYSQI